MPASVSAPASRPPRAPRLLAALTAVALAAGGALAAGPAVADDASGVAWTVQTVDGAHGADRPNFAYDVEPGDTISDAMLVSNTGTTALPLSVYAADAFTTASGNLDILPGGTPSTDAGTWVTPAQTDLVLKPGEHARVAFTIAVPADARPGDHPAGIVTSLVSDSASGPLTVDRRLGTRINLRVAGELVPAATASGLAVSFAGSWNPFAPGTLVLDYRLENTGNTRITAVDSATAAGPLGLAPSFGAPQQLAEVVPGSTIDVHRELAAPAFGWLGGSLQIEPEGVGLGAGSIDAIVLDYGVVAVPWGLLLLVVLVAAATVALLIIVRRKGRRRMSDGPAAEESAAAETEPARV